MPDGARFSGESGRETAIDGPPASFQAASAGLSLPPGTILAGRYEVHGRLGRGGMGIVLRARDRVLGEDVAVKVLRPELVHERQWVERLAREVKLARQIHHPNVCRVFDFVQSDGQAFIVMELAERTLRDELEASERGGATPGLAEQRLADARAVAQGLAAVHAAGIVHRDVTPNNVLRLRDGRLALSDFGLAIDDTQTSASVRGGTIAYMAPELAGGGRASVASDIWALGVVIHEIVFGRRPHWRGGVTGTRIEAPSQRMANWEREVLSVCRHCTMAPIGGRPKLAHAIVGRLGSVEGLRHRIRLRQRVSVSLGGLTILTAMLAVLVVVARVDRRRNKRIGITAAHLDDHAIEITGNPEDWTTSSRVLAKVPGKVHCLRSVPGARTIRFAWGFPKRVDELNLDTGDLRPAALVPEAMAEGCPDLSPDGRELIFQGYDSHGHARIFRSSHADGSAAVSVVAAADPSYLSEPRWFAGGAAFVFDADTRHVGVVDRASGRPTIVAEAPGDGDWTLFRFVCRDLLYVVQTNSALQAVLTGYRWPSLQPSGRTTLVSDPNVAWHSEDCRTFFGAEGVGDSIVELDIVRRHARRLGRVNEKWASLMMLSGPDLIFSSVSVRSDLWIRDTSGRMRPVTTRGDVWHAAACRNGDFLVVTRDRAGTEINRLGADGRFIALDHRQGLLPACSHRSDGLWWYTDYSHAPSTTFRCNGRSSCKAIAEGVGLGFALSPDDARLAFLINSNRGVRVQWMPSEGGPVHDLGETETACAPGWTSDRTLWISRRLRGVLTWTEIDVDTGQPTGRAAPGGKSCADGLPDPASPVDMDVRVVFDYKTEIRLKRLP